MLKNIISTVKDDSIIAWNYFNDIKIEELTIFNINNILMITKYIKILQENFHHLRDSIIKGMFQYNNDQNILKHTKVVQKFIEKYIVFFLAIIYKIPT